MSFYSSLTSNKMMKKTKFTKSNLLFVNWKKSQQETCHVMEPLNNYSLIK